MRAPTKLRFAGFETPSPINRYPVSFRGAGRMAEFAKATLLGQKQSWIRKTSTTAADAALHLKKQHCCRG